MNRFSRIGAATLSITLAATLSASAMHDPEAIDWTGPPSTFVSSLFVGVFGREDYSPAAQSWTKQVTKNPSSRLSLFKQFLNSPEYKKLYGGHNGVYRVYWKSDGAHHKSYTVAKTKPSGYEGATSNAVTIKVAQAIRGFLVAYRSSD